MNTGTDQDPEPTTQKNTNSDPENEYGSGSINGSKYNRNTQEDDQ
jgi:hypothetical protein